MAGGRLESSLVIWIELNISSYPDRIDIVGESNSPDRVPCKKIRRVLCVYLEVNSVKLTVATCRSIVTSTRTVQLSMYQVTDKDNAVSGGRAKAQNQ